MKKLLLVLLLAGGLFGSECEDYYSDYLEQRENFMVSLSVHDIPGMKVENDLSIIYMQKYLECEDNVKLKKICESAYADLLLLDERLLILLETE